MTDRTTKPMAPDLSVFPDWVGTVVMLLAAFFACVFVAFLLMGAF